jgi:hypothetical protein
MLESRAFTRKSDWVRKMRHVVGEFVEVMLSVFGVKVAQAYGAEAVAHQTSEEVAITAHRAGTQFLGAARQIALFDELGQRPRPFGLRVAAVDRRENLGDQRRDIFFRAVIVGIVASFLHTRLRTGAPSSISS